MLSCVTIIQPPKLQNSISAATTLPVKTTPRLSKRTGHGLPRPRTLEIKHVPPKVIQFRLHKLSRKISTPHILDVFQRGTQARNVCVGADALQHHPLQSGKGFTESLGDTSVYEKVGFTGAVLVNLLQKV